VPYRRKKLTFAISSSDEFLSVHLKKLLLTVRFLRQNEGGSKSQFCDQEDLKNGPLVAADVDECLFFSHECRVVFFAYQRRVESTTFCDMPTQVSMRRCFKSPESRTSDLYACSYIRPKISQEDFGPGCLVASGEMKSGVDCCLP